MRRHTAFNRTFKHTKGNKISFRLRLVGGKMKFMENILLGNFFLENKLIFCCLNIISKNIFQCLVYKGKSISFNNKDGFFYYDLKIFLMVKFVLIIKKSCNILNLKLFS